MLYISVSIIMCKVVRDWRAYHICQYKYRISRGIHYSFRLTFPKCEEALLKFILKISIFKEYYGDFMLYNLRNVFSPQKNIYFISCLSTEGNS